MLLLKPYSILASTGHSPLAILEVRQQTCSSSYYSLKPGAGGMHYDGCDRSKHDDPLLSQTQMFSSWCTIHNILWTVCSAPPLSSGLETDTFPWRNNTNRRNDKNESKSKPHL